MEVPPVFLTLHLSDGTGCELVAIDQYLDVRLIGAGQIGHNAELAVGLAYVDLRHESAQSSAAMAHAASRRSNGSPAEAVSEQALHIPVQQGDWRKKGTVGVAAAKATAAGQ
jgi:hypothetical protein